MTVGVLEIFIFVFGFEMVLGSDAQHINAKKYQFEGGDATGKFNNVAIDQALKKSKTQ